MSSTPLRLKHIVYDKEPRGGGGPPGTDILAKVTAADTTAGYLNGKLTAGANISLTVGTPGGNETLAIAATGLSVSGHDHSATYLQLDCLNDPLTGDLVFAAGNSISCPQGVGTETFGAGITTGAALGATAVGNGATASGDGSVAIGNGATADGVADCVVIGNGAITVSDTSTAIGAGASVAGVYDTAIGYGATADGLTVGSTAVGNGAVSGYWAVAVGTTAIASGMNSFALGWESHAGGVSGMAFGMRAVADFNNSICFNIGATTKGNQCVFNSVSEFVIGVVTSASAPNVLLTSSSGYHASQSNKKGSAITIQTGIPTGNNATTCYLQFKTPQVGSTGTTPQTMYERLTIGQAPAAGGEGIIVNDIGADYNFRIEGDTDAQLFMVDASTDRIGIGIAAPTVKLDVVGAGKFSTDLTVVGTILNPTITTPTIVSFVNANHTHAAAGATGGTIDHGVLTGLGDDDHTIYTQKATLTEKGDLYYASAASTPAARAHGNAGQILRTGGHGADPTWIDNVVSVTFIIDGGGSAITAGFKGWLEIPFACTLTAYTLLADVAGAIVVDVWRDSYANFPPVNADAMPGAGKEPTIVATNQMSQDLDISDWTTVAVAAGDILGFYVDSATTITKVTLALRATKT